MLTIGTKIIVKEGYQLQCQNISGSEHWVDILPEFRGYISDKMVGKNEMLYIVTTDPAFKIITDRHPDGAWIIAVTCVEADMDVDKSTPPFSKVEALVNGEWVTLDAYGELPLGCQVQVMRPVYRGELLVAQVGDMGTVIGVKEGEYLVDLNFKRGGGKFWAAQGEIDVYTRR